MTNPHDFLVVYINGFGGDDIIGVLYLSNYVINGGAGNDIFKLDSVSDSQPGLLRDVIKDFNPAVLLLMLDRTVHT